MMPYYPQLNELGKYVAGVTAALLLGPALLRAAPVPATDWNDRNSPAVVNATAQEFLSLVNLDYRPTARRLLPLDEAGQLYRKGKYPEALTQFEHYFFDKLRDPNAYGLSVADLNPYVRGVCGVGMWPGEALRPVLNQADREQVLASADQLLNNAMVLDGKPTDIGAPGQVNWWFPLASADQLTLTNLPAGPLVSAHGFTPLVQAWLLTRNPAYLKKWADFMDDWALNCHYPDAIHPCIVPDSKALGDVEGMTKLLAVIAQSDEQAENLIPPETFAHLIRKLLYTYPLYSIVYTRSNTHNWTPSATLMMVAMVYDEFKVAPFYFREARRRNIEDNAVTQNLRDGAENQQDPWYNGNYLQVAAALRLLAVREKLPTWKEVPWVNELRQDELWKQDVQEHLNARVNYFIHLRTPQNEWPIPFRGGDKRGAVGVPPGGLYALAPDAYQAPVNRDIVAAILHPEEGIQPPYTADWFPYAGFYIVRDGWQRTDGYGALFCSPEPGAYGAYRSRSNNNTFGLNAFGQDLLVDDTVGHYMYPSSPITVDGKQQFFHAGIYKVPKPAAHKVFEVSAWTHPAPWRWFASDRFNVLEGIYAGPYGNLADKPSVKFAYGQDESMQGTLTLAETMQGITHQRVVLYLRQAKVWIVTDRLTAKESHRYDQFWRIPIAPSRFAQFKPEDIEVDQAHTRIVTQCADAKQANISLYQFSTAPLEYHSAVQPQDPKNHYQMYGWKKIDVAWTAQGNSQVITAIYPRHPGAAAADDLQEVQSLGTGGNLSGFSATAPDGTHIQYLTAANRDDTLKLGPITMQGEALLLTDDGGIALGCRSISVNGKPLTVAGPDFVFHRNGPATIDEFQPIYRPIEPVVIDPPRNVFDGQLPITMNSPTPDVEIRYTLDGTDPTPQSARYTGPITLAHTTLVKARAYRPGVTQNPIQLSGTDATVVTRALFTREDLLDPVTVRKPEPGLDYAYYQADWKQLWLLRDELQPAKSGVVTNLFDLSVVPADNPPLGKALAPRQKYYAFVYTGYLAIPQDGVYTFHAPREYVMPDTAAGYELQVSVGQDWVLFGGRKKVDGLNEWYPATSLHALGNWSIGLKAGLQPFRVVYVDYRTSAVAKLNQPGLNNYIWDGTAPDLEISGPGLTKQLIPTDWLRR